MKPIPIFLASCSEKSELIDNQDENLNQSKTLTREVYSSLITPLRACDINIVRNLDGTAGYSYSERPAVTGDLYRSYSLDQEIIKDSKNSAHITVPAGETYYYIPFLNPTTPSIVTGGGYYFVCECCATGTVGLAGGCQVHAQKYNNSWTIDCTQSTCTGECGLNAIPDVRNNNPGRYT